MLRAFVADLHVHTVLSPCASIEMTPHNIVRCAEQLGIDIIAITDHNACDNVAAALEAAATTRVTVLPGMELETKEEVHLIVLFDKLCALQKMCSFVAKHLSGRLNDEKKFGAQMIVDAEDNLIELKQERLLEAVNIGINEAVAKVKELGGICIASHVDRPVYSIVSQLGFIPPEIDLAAVEVSRRIKASEAALKIPQIKSFTVISSSDAHTIEELITGPRTVFYIQNPTLAEIKQALCSQNLRRVVV